MNNRQKSKEPEISAEQSKEGERMYRFQAKIPFCSEQLSSSLAGTRDTVPGPPMPPLRLLSAPRLLFKDSETGGLLSVRLGA